MLMGRGIIEFIDVGDDPPVLGTRVSTSGMALSEVDDVFETILTAENFVYSTHWSDARFGRVEVQDGNEAAVITIRLNEEGQETLRRFANRRRGSFLTIALDNVAIASFPVAEAVEEDLLIIRRLDPHVANGLVGIMRHGPLQLVPQYELAP